MAVIADELYSLLVPLADERLIVPRACVAEVVRYTPPVQKETEHPWMLGSISWNGRDLPVVAFEGAEKRMCIIVVAIPVQAKYLDRILLLNVLQ